MFTEKSFLRKVYYVGLLGCLLAGTISCGNSVSGPASAATTQVTATPTLSGVTPTASPTQVTVPAVVEVTATSPAPEGVSTPPPPAELRGVWMSAKSMNTPEKTRQTLDRIAAAGLNTVFVNVFLRGEAYYNSELLSKTTALDDPTFDPLAYLIEEAHRRNLQVHAWFVVGPVGAYDGGLGPILAEHPEWGAVAIDGSQSAHWLNFSRPDVRNFIGDVVLEVVNNYNVQGIHFDYVRYPNRNLGFDEYSARAFKEEYGIDLETLRYPTLPAYGYFRGNPLDKPTTAQILAYFENGYPAILLNTYGQGRVILFNWSAARRDVMVSTEIFKRSLAFLQADQSSNIYLLDSATNAERYGHSSFRDARAWLQDVDHLPLTIEEGEVGDLEAGSVLVLPNVYIITPEVAANLAAYVEQGGNIVFIDGPVYAIEDKNIQALTGMSDDGDYFEEETLLLARQEHPLIPNNPDASQNLADYQATDKEWQAFRKEGINHLVQEVYQRVKQRDLNVQLSAAVYHNKAGADRVLQDWYTWLENGYIDFVVPMAYGTALSELGLDMVEWSLAAPGGFERIIPGLAVADFDQASEPPTPVDDILNEIFLVQTGGARGVVLYSIDFMTDETIDALRQGPFAR